MQSLQIIGEGGEIITASVVPQNKLFKADRMIDHQCINKLTTLKPVEFKLLMLMWEKCNKFNFVAENIGVDVADRKYVSLAIKSLIKSDWIKKAKILTGKQKWKSGFMVNPFYFRKAKSYDDYRTMTDNYNFGIEAQVVMSFHEMVKEQGEMTIRETHTMEPVVHDNPSSKGYLDIRVGDGIVFRCLVERS